MTITETTSRCLSCGDPSDKPVCAKCSLKAEISFVTNKNIDYMQTQVSIGLLPEIFKRWTRPPVELTAMNLETWLAFGPDKFDPRNGHVLFIGPEGVGKTSLARCMMRSYCLQHGVSIAEISGSTLEVMANGWDLMDRLKPYQYSGILLLDDIGNAGWTKRGLNALRMIIETRHDLRKCMIITSNQTEGELKQKFSQVMDENFAISTLRRLSPVQKHFFKGESYRVKMNEKIS